MEFVSSPPYTLGVEWELQLLDQSTLDLRPGIRSLMQRLEGNEFVKPELIQSCVELNSPVSQDSAAVHAHFLFLAREVARACAEQGMSIVGAGTHPFCQRLALITPLPRFKELASEHGFIGQSQIAFATHVHIGLPSGDQAVRVMRYLVPALPLLIALAANSPFWRGHQTGYASYRRRLLAVARSYGIPPYFENWRQFSEFMGMAKKAGSIQTLKDIHWDIRPHPDFGTLEVRVMDAQSTVADLTFVAGLTRLLVAWICSSSRDQIEAILPRHLSPWIDRENHFRASHWGVEALLIDDLAGNTRPIRYYLATLAEALSELAKELQEKACLERLNHSVTNPPGYLRQEKAYEESQNTLSVVKDLKLQLYREIGF